jgi:hypothetical protein
MKHQQHPRTTLDISPLYDEALAASPNSLPPLAKIKVTVEKQMTRAFGRAFPLCFKRRNGQVVKRDYYAITISAPWHIALTNMAPEEAASAQLRDTILHELAHISMYFLYPGRNEVHGPRWQAQAATFGAVPSRNAWEGNSRRTIVPGTDITWREIEMYKNHHFKAPNA